MDEIGVDLILLTARPGGTLPERAQLCYGLSGSELVRLVAVGRVDIVNGRIVVVDLTPTGDPLLDQALDSMSGGRRGPTAKAWVARRRSGHLRGYQARLAADGVIRADRRTFLGFIPVTRWTVADAARAARARARLEAVAASTGPVEPAQAALAGLAGPVGAASLVFPGWSGRAARNRLKQAARGDLAAAGASQAAAGASARDDAYRDSIRDSLTLAVDSAVQAAVHAAADAAHHAASSSAHHGGAGGHH